MLRFHLSLACSQFYHHLMRAGAIVTSILEMRDLRPRELSISPSISQVVSDRVRVFSFYFSFKQLKVILVIELEHM